MFRGRGEQLTLTAAPGQRFTVFGVSFEQPHTFGTDNSFLASGMYSHEELPDFSLWQVQLRVGLERELADHWWASFGPTVLATELWNLDRHDIPDYNDATGYTPGYGAWGRLSYTTTPDTPIVNRGVRASLMIEPLYEDVSFLRTTLAASRFFPVHGEGFDAHVLEVSGEAGQILGNAPVFERFFCGGLGSVRGFDVWGISPLYNGDPIGGFYFLTARTQYEFPIWRPIEDVYLRGVLFVDSGDAETRLGDMGRIRVASGFGLRAVLPKFNGMSAGINFAWPLNSYRGDDTQVFTFFMGMGM
jgi:outer membrane protein insertion porin family